MELLEEEEEKLEEDTGKYKDIIFKEEGDPLAVVSSGSINLLSSSVDEMATAARDDIGVLNLKKTGSTRYDTKNKSLFER